MASAPPKEYGLLMRKKPTEKPGPVAQFNRLAAFGDDSSDDDNGGGTTTSATKPKVNIALGDAQRRQIQRAQATALDSDPTIFQYDELYDDMQVKRDADKAARNSARSADKGPKYIKRLLVTAESRKKEYERRIERQVQKEREAEGEQFKDKESFVTASYRAKLEEIKVAEEAEKRNEYLESIGDVTKQRDLGGFYRHLYEQKIGGETAATTTTSATTVAPSPPSSAPKQERTYRKRKATSDQENSDGDEKDPTTETTKKTHIQSNLDADSDFSIDSESDTDDNDAETSGKNVVAVEGEKVAATATNAGDAVFVKPAAPADKVVKVEQNADEKKPPQTDEISAPPKFKVDIWKKRTVGDVLDAAIQRYYERKVARESGWIFCLIFIIFDGQ